jgi:helix-turn-helix protein
MICRFRHLPISEDVAMKRVTTKGSTLLADYLGEREAARELLQSLRTLRAWRQRGIGPAWTKVGRRVHYSRTALLAWLSKQERQPVRVTQP